MLFIIGIVLLFWVLGAFVFPSLGAIVHVLLIVALAVLVYNLTLGRKA